MFNVPILTGKNWQQRIEFWQKEIVGPPKQIPSHAYGIYHLRSKLLEFYIRFKCLELELEKLISVSNHPVHLVKSSVQYSPSALIPFCEFGGNMSSMGVTTQHFDFPVCNSFQATILNDQLCYEVDLNKFSNKDNIENELKSGFAFHCISL